MNFDASQSWQFKMFFIIVQNNNEHGLCASNVNTMWFSLMLFSNSGCEWSQLGYWSWTLSLLFQILQLFVCCPHQSIWAEFDLCWKVSAWTRQGQKCERQHFCLLFTSWVAAIKMPHRWRQSFVTKNLIALMCACALHLSYISSAGRSDRKKKSYQMLGGKINHSPIFKHLYF